MYVCRSHPRTTSLKSSRWPSTDTDKDLDVPGIWASAREINAIIISEVDAGLPENKIILGCSHPAALVDSFKTQMMNGGRHRLQSRLRYDADHRYSDRACLTHQSKAMLNQTCF